MPSSAKYSQLSGIRTRVGGNERIEREETERRRRIDEDVVEVVAQRRQQVAQPRSRCGSGTSSISAPVSSRSAGMSDKWSMPVGMMNSRASRPAP